MKCISAVRSEIKIKLGRRIFAKLIFKDFRRLFARYPQMPFAVPIVWRDPQNDLKDFCFYMTKITGFPQFSMHNIKYPNIPFALRPAPHDDSMPVSKLPKSYTLDSD
jgi:hypothetical protein